MREWVLFSGSGVEMKRERGENDIVLLTVNVSASHYSSNYLLIP